MSEPILSTTEQDALKARGRRNLAIAGALLVFVALVFTVTIVRLSAASHIQGDQVRAERALKPAPVAPRASRP